MELFYALGKGQFSILGPESPSRIGVTRAGGKAHPGAYARLGGAARASILPGLGARSPDYLASGFA